MTLTLDLTQDIAEALSEAAARQGRSREELAIVTLQRLFLPQEDSAALLANDILENDIPEDGSTLSERGFLMAVEGTRHIWGTPEEDKAWAHL